MSIPLFHRLKKIFFFFLNEKLFSDSAIILKSGFWFKGCREVFLPRKAYM